MCGKCGKCRKHPGQRRGLMRYRIEYADGRCCNFANRRKELIERLELLKDETVSDIRKLYKRGDSDSVMDKYKQCIRKEPNK